MAGTTFLMGPGGPALRRHPPPGGVHDFWTFRQAGTNREFDRFLQATDHVTLPRSPLTQTTIRAPTPRWWSLPPPFSARPRDWWTCRSRTGGEPTAAGDWRHPHGPGILIDGLAAHPVVWADVVAYARWAGRRLPTEAEWELAA